MRAILLREYQVVAEISCRLPLGHLNTTQLDIAPAGLCSVASPTTSGWSLSGTKMGLPSGRLSCPHSLHLKRHAFNIHPPKLCPQVSLALTLSQSWVGVATGQCFLVSVSARRSLSRLHAACHLPGQPETNLTCPPLPLPPHLDLRYFPKLSKHLPHSVLSAIPLARGSFLFLPSTPRTTFIADTLCSPTKHHLSRRLLRTSRLNPDSTRSVSLFDCMLHPHLCPPPPETSPGPGMG